MLRGSMSPLGTDSSDTSSSEDDDQVDSSTWPGRLWAVPHDAIQRLSL